MQIKSATFGQLQNNCYLVTDEASGRSALVDCTEYSDKMKDFIGDAKLDYILLTHGHFDHIGGVKELAARYGIPVYGSRDELPLFTDLRRNQAVYVHGTPERYHVEPDHLVEDGDEITLDELTIRVLATPGHTPGGVCYLCGGLLFSGDTLFAGSIGRCDLLGGDYETLLHSLSRLDQLEGEYQVLPGHGHDSTLTYEKAANPYFEEMRRLSR